MIEAMILPFAPNNSDRRSRCQSNQSQKNRIANRFRVRSRFLRIYFQALSHAIDFALLCFRTLFAFVDIRPHANSLGNARPRSPGRPQICAHSDSDIVDILKKQKLVSGFCLNCEKQVTLCKCCSEWASYK
jgi:hypothetical protein